MLTNEYLKRVYDGLAQRNANEPEFLQAVREVLESIQPVVEKLSLIHILANALGGEGMGLSRASALPRLNSSAMRKPALRKSRPCWRQYSGKFSALTA